MRATAVPMPENTNWDKEDGLWRVEVRAEISEPDYRFPNSSYQEAFKKAGELNDGYRKDGTLH